MILKASRIASIGHARKMAAHLLKEENELVQLWETTEPDHTGDALENSLVDMQLLTKMTKGQRGIFHVAIAPRDHETMSREQWGQAVVSIEQEFGLAGQARCLVYHEKENRPHLHVCWSIVDIDRGRIIDPKFDKVRLQTIAQELEKEFGHEPTRRYANDNSIEVSDKDRARESKVGRSALEQKELLSRLWKDAKTPEDFLEVVKEEGYLVAKGDKAAIIVVDGEGTPYNLARQLPKLVKAKDVRNRFAEVNLPSFEQAKEAQLNQVQQNNIQVREDEREEVRRLSRQEVEKEKTRLALEQQRLLEEAQERFEEKVKTFRQKQREKEESEGLTRDTEKKPLTPGEERERQRESLRKAQTFTRMVEMFRKQREQEQAEICRETEEARSALIITYNTQKAQRLQRNIRNRDRSDQGRGRDDGGRTLDDDA